MFGLRCKLSINKSQTKLTNLNLHVTARVFGPNSQFPENVQPAFKTQFNFRKSEPIIDADVSLVDAIVEL